MRHLTYTVSVALAAAMAAGCSQGESATEGRHVGSSLGGNSVPEGYFVATFSTSGTRAEADFNAITGEDPRVFDLRYLLYDEEGNFVKERLIFDDFDEDDDDTQDWPLPSISDTLPVGRYRAVFIANTDPDLFQRGAGNMALPEDLLTDYELGFDQARVNLPYLLGAYDPDFFMDVIEFSHEDPAETVYLQRIVGIFKAYRSLADAQEGLDSLVADLVHNITEGGIIEKQVEPLLDGALGQTLSPVTDLLGALNLDGIIIDPLVKLAIGPTVEILYELLLKNLTSMIGGLLEGNNGGRDLTDILDPLLNPWLFADYAVVAVANQPVQFGFDMEVKKRDPATHKYYLPIVTDSTDRDMRRVVITKYLGFADIDNDGVGDELMTLVSINAAEPGLVGGLLLDDVVESEYLLDGALFDIDDPLDFHAPNNLQVHNEYSVVDLGVDDYSQQGSNLTLGLTLRDVVNLDDALGALLTNLLNLQVPRAGIPPWQSLEDLLDSQGINLLDMPISLPINLPLLELSNLDVAGGWDPYNTVETPD